MAYDRKMRQSVFELGDGQQVKRRIQEKANSILMEKYFTDDDNKEIIRPLAIIALLQIKH